VEKKSPSYQWRVRIPAFFQFRKTFSNTFLEKLRKRAASPIPFEDDGGPAEVDRFYACILSEPKLGAILDRLSWIESAELLSYLILNLQRSANERELTARELWALRETQSDYQRVMDDVRAYRERQQEGGEGKVVDSRDTD
jgi:hypothetical protein